MKHRPPFDVCVCMCGACEEQEDETIKSNHWIEIIDTKNVINSAHSSKSRNAVTLVFLLCFRHISQMNSFFFDFTPVKKRKQCMLSEYGIFNEFSKSPHDSQAKETRYMYSKYVLNIMEKWWVWTQFANFDGFFSALSRQFRSNMLIFIPRIRRMTLPPVPPIGNFLFILWREHAWNV